MAQISGTGMGGSTTKKVDLTAAAKKTATAAKPVVKTAASTASKVKVTPAPAKAKEPVATAAKKVASAAKPSIKSGSGGSSPTKRTVQTTTVRPKTSDPVGDGPSLGMLYDFMGTPATNLRDVPVAPASRLRGTPTDAPGSQFPSFAEYLDVVSPSFARRPEGGLNSDAYYERAAEAGGKPFEGVVDWGGIASAVGLGGQPAVAYKPEPIDITVRGGNRVPDPGLTWVEAQRSVFNPGANPERLTADAPISAGPAPFIPDDRMSSVEYNAYDQSYTPTAVTAIDGAAPVEVVGLPRRDPRGYTAAPAGIDAAVAPAPKEPTMWDGVVDNTGKLLEHTGLGGIVKELFPDMWYGTGETMKGLDDGNSGTRDLNAERKRSNERARERFRQQQAANPQPDGGGRFPDLNHNGIDDRIEGYTGPDTGQPPANPTVPVWDLPPTRVASFPNMPPYNPGRDNEWSYFTNNHLADGGIVAAVPGYAGGGWVASDYISDYIPGGGQFGNVMAMNVRLGQLVRDRAARPGSADDSGISTAIRMLRQMIRDTGGTTKYAEGGEVDSFDSNDPRMALIGQTEDVLEKIAGGAKPDANDAEVLKAFVAQFGDAALKSLNDNVTGGMTMKSGRMIKGPGGPKDDAVPAVIVEEGSVVSPAKLSNGEFVMPVSAVEGAGGPEALQELADRLSRKSAA